MRKKKSGIVILFGLIIFFSTLNTLNSCVDLEDTVTIPFFSEESSTPSEKENIETSVLIQNVNNISKAPEINLLSSNGAGITLEMHLSEVGKEDITTINGEEFQKFTLLGGGRIAEVGKPELPTMGIYLDVPNGVEFEVEIRTSRFQELEGYNIYPYQPALTDTEREENPFLKDSSFYETNSFYPNEIVYAKEAGIIRGHRTVLMTICPIAHNPVSKNIRIYSELNIFLKYRTPGIKTSDDTIKQINTFNGDSEAFKPLFENIFLNYQSPTKASSEESRLKTASGNEGEGYLIITPELFYDEILPLAQSKTWKGLVTDVINLMDIPHSGPSPTADNITTYIKNAYETWNPAPSYLLLVGDVNLMPTHYKTDHPSYNDPSATDLYYATVDGTDIFPDIFVGRLPVKTEAELNIVVNKILDYERDFNSNDEWRQKVLLAADDEEGRYFIDTSESIKDFLETQEFICNTVYTGGSYTGTTDDVIDYINEGAFLVNHRDHGSPNGWTHPSFKVSDIPSLNNDDMLPVILSINCESGYFDGEEDCFGEAMLKVQDKGAVGYIGASRISYSGYNDELDKGFIASIWPEYYLGYTNYVGNSAELGPILNFGKMFMYDKYFVADPNGYPDYPKSEAAVKMEFEIFNLFGDPELTIYEAGHDLAATLEIPSFANVSNSYIINATVANNGIFDESNVNFYLYQNGTCVASATNLNLPSSFNETIQYVWEPTEYGNYNFTAYVEVVPEERIKLNNRLTEIISLVGHDLSVSLDYLRSLYIDKESNINVILSNIGLNRETNIHLSLYCDGDLVLSDPNIELSSGENTLIIHAWTPNGYGPFNFTAYIEPVNGEKNLDNNKATAFIYAYDSPIYIDDMAPDSFGSITWEEALDEDWCSFNDGAYVIENLTIAGDDSTSAIRISDSAANFIIKNCTIKYGGGEPNGKIGGINLENVEIGLITNNTFLENEYGIYISSSKNITIMKNDIHNNKVDGIYIKKSNNTIISGNEIYYNYEKGIFISSCLNTNISGNVIYYIYDKGICISYSLITYISRNNVSYNDDKGISIELSNVVVISGNEIHSNDYGVYSIYSVNTLISENEIYSNEVGVYNINSAGIYVSENEIYSNDNGVYNIFSGSINVSKNEIYSNNYGVDYIFCNYNFISENDIYSNNEIGITIYLSKNISLSNNDVYNNLLGIYILYSNSTFISDNVVYANGEEGIRLYESNFNNITGNKIQNNIGPGLSLGRNSDENLIYNNNFTGNTINAIDSGISNSWNNDTIGNSWDDYDGFDINDNGIGDSPYLIPGSADSQDNFPIYNDGPNDDDWYEPNDLMSEAYNLTSYENVWLSSINGLGMQADSDWFVIYAISGQILNIECLFSHVKGNINILVFNSTESNPLVEYSASDTDDEHIEFLVSSSGYYWILIVGDNARNLYDLLWNITVLDDDYEPNDYISEAYNLTAYENIWLSEINGPGIQWNGDWFEIYATSGQILNIECLFSHINGDIDLSLWYRIDSSTIARIDYSWSNTDNESIEVSIPFSRIYYIEIDGDNTGNVYDLRWYTSGSSPDDNYEQNDIMSEAYNLTSYENVWLSSIDDYGIQADEDWYEIYATAGYILNIEAIFSYEAGDIDLYLFDESENQITYITKRSDYEEIIFCVPTSGNYYIRVTGDNAGNAYNLRWNNSVVGSDDNYEQNNIYWEAFNLTSYENMWLGDINGLGIQWDFDAYAFNTTVGQKIYIDCLFSHEEGDINLYVLNGTGMNSFVTSSFSDTDDESVEFLASISGTYYLAIFGDCSGNSYNLRWYSEVTPEPPINGDDDDDDDDNDDDDISFLFGNYFLLFMFIAIFGIIGIIGWVIFKKRNL